MASLAGSTVGLGCSAKRPTMLEQLLEEINFQRTKEMRQLLKDSDSGFVMLQGTTYWTDLFVRHFLFQAEHTIDGDDLLFFVRKKHVKASSRFLPKFETEVDVFRKDSKKLPIGDPDIDWEETVYLNLVVHQFDYTLTLAICTRTSPKELQVLRRHSQKVYASPSRRRMDAKGDLEEMTYPHICFMVDNFDEVFCDILVRDGEMVCVELVASDREGAIQGVIFLGSIRYDALKKVYDARSSLSTKMAQRMTFGLFSGAASQRVEFVRMKGPQGKGHAEMAVTKPKGSGAETPTSEPGYCVTDALWDADWDDAEELFMYRHQRRLSDPSSNLNNFVRGGWKTKPDSAATKARSENEGLDSMANGLSEIEAGDVRDAMSTSYTNGDSNGQVRACVEANRSGHQSVQSSPLPSRRSFIRPARFPGGAVRVPGSPLSQLGRASTRHGSMLATDEQRHSDSHGLGDDSGCDVTRDESTTSDTTAIDQSKDQQKLEIGSEPPISSTKKSGLSEDKVRRRLDSGAILVNGTEELPLVFDSNETNGTNGTNGTPSPVPEQTPRLAERRRVRSRSLVNDGHQTPASPSIHSSFRDRPRRFIVDDFVTASRNQTGIATPLGTSEKSQTLPRRRRVRSDSGLGQGASLLPPHRVTPDGTAIYYWCELPRPPGYQELDDGAYNPLWTMRGFTQTFHFWKETKRAQSVPLNAFLTYITLPWWSIAKDILDHREGPILTF
ncbi:hypothetical protein QAD02_015466 [Eretmocerus hayati]|uniref:Uncharacterized protein n=1 Tax=Eretmocerus hayati TaxID=131215 RepID=A0ACC2P8R9_9HYME|nr:hypothetical protein QAD02_015466 [Eretmocerus hayati]